ncbi:hypothetical protein HJD18_15525 [Thermoleophilia bacterium SCSIO 60948]|nr:hypothetical protein HJD18_15525 [Thermoleophilia bacterium SCSIO 60948]
MSAVRSRPFAPFAIAAALLPVLACLVVPSQAAAAPKVSLADKSQAKALETNKLKVKLGKIGPGRYAVTAKKGGKAIARPAKGRIGKRPKTVSLTLTKSGAQAISGCSKHTIALGAKVGKKTYRGSGTLVNDPKECPKPKPYTGPEIDTPNSSRCDVIETRFCLQPFPNDFYTVEDPDTETGRRVAIDERSMPDNVRGNEIDPTDINRADGFSPGQPIVLKVPGLDDQATLDANGTVDITDLGAYREAAQRIVVIDADTGERHPIFTEMDAVAEDDADRVLWIRPATNFLEGHRYIVALRDLRDADGDVIEPSPAFKVLRDRLITTQEAIEDRRPAMDDIIATLQDSGIQRKTLYLAWDFTVASGESLAGNRVLEMRDDAFAELGDTNLADGIVQGDSPDFQVTSVTDYTPEANANLLRRVEGTIDVPCYLNVDGCPPGATFDWASDDAVVPTFNDAFRVQVPFVCTIPRSVVDNGTLDPARPSLYGHGLLGSRNEVGGGTGQNISLMANEHNFSFCAVNWDGFSSDDQGSVVASLTDLSNFPRIADRVQQGYVNFMYLGRAMIHPDGLGSDPAFQVDPDDGGPTSAGSVFDTTELFYDGNSQGGILGGALTALAPDFTRASLGVPGMNYSTLIQRSVDFDEYAEGVFDGSTDTDFGLYDNYDDQLELPLVLSVTQMMWDRADSNGFAQHMTDEPYPNTPEHQVLMQLAYGDHQVSNLTAEVEARTIGAEYYSPTLVPGRHWADEDLFGLDPIAEGSTGSALVYWDGGPKAYEGTIGLGTDPAPLVNLPPREIDGFGDDPHSYPRRDVAARVQKSDFLQVDGEFSGCGGEPCFSNGWDGETGLP